MIVGDVSFFMPAFQFEGHQEFEFDLSHLMFQLLPSFYQTRGGEFEDIILTRRTPRSRATNATWIFITFLPIGKEDALGRR